MRVLVFLFLLVPMLRAQSEPALQRFFEGKRVRVRIDMPATHDGVDYRVGKDQPLDVKEYSARIRKFGVALRDGDEVMVTGIKVKGKNIEFQLGGGGYGVFGDESANVTAASIPKSDREKRLEHELKDENDPDRREHLKRELARVRDQREKEERYAREEAARLSAIKEREIAEKRLHAGSRFNIWYPEGYLKESIPTPQEVMTLLSEWVDFGELATGR